MRILVQLLDPINAAAQAVGEESSWVSTRYQTASTVLVALLLLALARVIGRRFLAYWALGWVSMVVGLFALDLNFRLENSSNVLLSAYWVAGDLFGFLLYAGCRDYAQNRPLRFRDGWLLAPPIIVGVIMPIYFTHINDLFPAHALLFGGFALLAFAQTLHARTREGQTLIGIRFLQCALISLVLLFWHYSVVMGMMRLRPTPSYLQYSALYDTVVEMAVALAQVVLATDSVRLDLEAANRKLATATEQLALAARTDALTGLLNRRAFDSIVADPTAMPLPGSVAVIDLNDLKPLNDEHGHAAGDAALRTVARALQLRTRLGDPVFRLGGDEFLVVLAGVTSAELTTRLQDLDRALRNSRLPGVHHPVDLSVAWGVAEYRGPDLANAVDRADTAMYACKQARKRGENTRAG